MVVFYSFQFFQNHKLHAQAVSRVPIPNIQPDISLKGCGKIIAIISIWIILGFRLKMRLLRIGASTKVHLSSYGHVSPEKVA